MTNPIVFPQKEIQQHIPNYWQALQAQAGYAHLPPSKSLLWSNTIYGQKNHPKHEHALAIENQHIHNYSLDHQPKYQQTFTLKIKPDYGDFTPQTPKQYKANTKKLQQALTHLKQYFPQSHEEFQNLTKTIAWFHSKSPGDISYSDPKQFGYIFVNHKSAEQLSPIQLATQLVHELAHHLLFIESARQDLLKDDYDKPSYSPFQQTTRPLIGTLHAQIAMARILNWGIQLDQANAHPIEAKRIFKLTTRYNQGMEELQHTSFPTQGAHLHKQFKALQTYLN